jgi:hypothetical protein
VVAPLTEGTPEALAGNYVARVRPVPAYTVVPPLLARLTLVDTLATHEAGSPDLLLDDAGVNPHGLAMAGLATRAVCDDDVDASPACAAELASELGLAFTWDGGGFAADADGGNFGSQGDLARAIHAAVATWEVDHAAGATGPLVVSLALGWHPEAGGSGALDAPAAAVKAALTYASCMDALVLAAVGNADTPTGCAERTGPLYPAGWEVDAAPTAAECASSTWDVADTPTDLIETVYRPLVYGVSGLDESLRTLANQRPSSRTLHAGPATQASAWSLVDADWMEPVSGTSVATTSVAAAAVVVRSHAPDLTAHDVMSVLRTAGAELDAAEVCYDPEADGCEAARSVTVCDGLRTACETEYGECDTSLGETMCGTLSAAEVLEPGAVAAATLTMAGSRAGRCGSGRYLTDGRRPRYACPWEQLYAGTTLPMTLPQPSGGECPWCPASLPNRVDLWPTQDLGTLRNLTVSVTKAPTFGAPVTTHYPLGVLSGASETVYLPDLVPTDANYPLDSSVTGIVLSYTYAGGTVSYTEPVALTWAP